MRVAPLLLVVNAGLSYEIAAQTRAAYSSSQQDFLRKLTAAAIERTHHSVRYDGAYVRIPYPNGDVPAETGVCTDEIIRVYRALGVDLQKLVHEDMLRNISAYPHKGQSRLVPDTSIDHRRVPNLMVCLLYTSDAADE